MTKKPTKERGTPKDVFAHLLSTVTLAMAVIAFTTIWWQVINIHFPDLLNDYYLGSIDLIRGMIAAIVVAWPIYLFLAWMIKKDIVAMPDKQNIHVRKWLMYFTLFVASITIIIDLVSLINSFLGGELTTRFALKILAVLVAAGAVFGYYLWDVRRDVTKKTQIPVRVAITSSLLMLVTLVFGFVQIGSPGHQRDLRLDQERVEDLADIQFQLLYWYRDYEELPTSLDQIATTDGYPIPTDPVTGEEYDYSLTGETTFDLCANFTTSSAEMEDQYPYARTPVKEYGFLTTTNWNHEAEYTCFQIELDPDYNETQPTFR